MQYRYYYCVAGNNNNTTKGGKRVTTSHHIQITLRSCGAVAAADGGGVVYINIFTRKVFYIDLHIFYDM